MHFSPCIYAGTYILKRKIETELLLHPCEVLVEEMDVSKRILVFSRTSIFGLSEYKRVFQLMRTSNPCNWRGRIDQTGCGFFQAL